MRLHRVFPWLPDAAERDPGRALFVPTPQRAGRIANSEVYSAMYLADAPAGAVAEAFGNLKLLTPAMFETPSLPGSRKALADYDLNDAASVFDLDDAAELSRLGLRPSQVVTKERSVTQSWALSIFKQTKWIGVRWWSYYDSRWHCFGIWDTDRVRCVGTQPLSLDHPAVVEASEVLRRPRRSASTKARGR